MDRKSNRIARDKRPNLPPINRITLSEDKFNLKLVLSIVLVAAALGIFAFVLFRLLSKSDGWQEIDVNSASYETCGAEFSFMYELGAGGNNSTAEAKQLSVLYTELCADAYRIFNANELFDGCMNLAYLNRNPNEPVKVEATLYEGLSLIESYGDRNIYLAPVYEQYAALFNCSYDYEAELFDPRKDDNQAAYFERLLTFINDENDVCLELLEDNEVILHVSDEYLSYAGENGIDTFVDFFWMKNAFIADYIADSLAEKGFTNGYIRSYDGFTCNLDSKGEYGFTIPHREESAVYESYTVAGKGGASVVILRDYMLTDLDILHYYEYENGDIVSPYIDISDGIPKCALSELAVFSYGTGCAELLLKTVPIYVAETFDESLIQAIGEDIDAVYFLNGTACNIGTGLTPVN